MYVGTIIKKKKKNHSDGFVCRYLMKLLQWTRPMLSLKRVLRSAGKAEVFLGLLIVAFTVMTWCIKLYQYITMFFI